VRQRFERNLPSGRAERASTISEVLHTLDYRQHLAGAPRHGDATLRGEAADDHEVIVTFRELARTRTRTQRRESYLLPPNGFSVVLSLNSAGRSISEARRFPSCCS
jgi:hypothetical protein